MELAQSSQNQIGLAEICTLFSTSQDSHDNQGTEVTDDNSPGSDQAGLTSWVVPALQGFLCLYNLFPLVDSWEGVSPVIKTLLMGVPYVPVG